MTIPHRRGITQPCLEVIIYAVKVSIALVCRLYLPATPARLRIGRVPSLRAQLNEGPSRNAWRQTPDCKSYRHLLMRAQLHGVPQRHPRPQLYMIRPLYIVAARDRVPWISRPQEAQFQIYPQNSPGIRRHRRCRGPCKMILAPDEI